jgi:hypothetical protein
MKIVSLNTIHLYSVKIQIYFFFWNISRASNIISVSYIHSTITDNLNNTRQTILALRCFVLVEINSPVEKRSSQKENVDSECDFPHQMASNFSYVASHSESSSKLSTQNSEEPLFLMQLDLMAYLSAVIPYLEITLKTSIIKGR